MSFRAGLAEIDITPPLGTRKIGWLKEIVADTVLDPLFARAAVFESEGSRIGFIQLDTLCVRWSDVADMRARIGRQYSLPGENVMVAATHNHAGPAVANIGDVKREGAYLQTMVEKIVAMFGEALERLQPAEIGFASVFEWGLSHNRRVVMRDGTVRTHGTFKDPNALYLEGPLDPEVAVVAARGAGGDLLGMLVNFACHPTHHGGDTTISAGFPGVLAAEMKRRGCPVTLFLNGACGNLAHTDPRSIEREKTQEEIGFALAKDAEDALAGMKFGAECAVGSRTKTIQLRFRRVTDEEVRGTAKGAQRFVDPAIYDRCIPGLVEQIRRHHAQPAEVQVIQLGECAFVGLPAEYFVQNGLKIKEGSHPRHALVVSCANGMVGYVPHKQAFLRGGYETTFAPWSKLSPAAGAALSSAAISLVRGQAGG